MLVSRKVQHAAELDCIVPGRQRPQRYWCVTKRNLLHSPNQEGRLIIKGPGRVKTISRMPMADLRAIGLLNFGVRWELHLLPKGHRLFRLELRIQQRNFVPAVTRAEGALGNLVEHFTILLAYRVQANTAGIRRGWRRR